MDIVIFSQSFGAGEHGPLHRISKPESLTKCACIAQQSRLYKFESLFWTGRDELLLIPDSSEGCDFLVDQMSGSSSP